MLDSIKGKFFHASDITNPSKEKAFKDKAAGRLKFEGLDDAVYMVAAKKLDVPANKQPRLGFWEKFWYVPLKVTETNIDGMKTEVWYKVNINSLATRFHLSKGDIKKDAQHVVFDAILKHIPKSPLDGRVALLNITEEEPIANLPEEPLSSLQPDSASHQVTPPNQELVASPVPLESDQVFIDKSTTIETSPVALTETSLEIGFHQALEASQELRDDEKEVFYDAEDSLVTMKQSVEKESSVREEEANIPENDPSNLLVTTDGSTKTALTEKEASQSQIKNSLEQLASTTKKAVGAAAPVAYIGLKKTASIAASVAYWCFGINNLNEAIKSYNEPKRTPPVLLTVEGQEISVSVVKDKTSEESREAALPEIKKFFFKATFTPLMLYGAIADFGWIESSEGYKKAFAFPYRSIKSFVENQFSSENLKMNLEHINTITSFAKKVKEATDQLFVNWVGHDNTDWVKEKISGSPDWLGEKINLNLDWAERKIDQKPELILQLILTAYVAHSIYKDYQANAGGGRMHQVSKIAKITGKLAIISMIWIKAIHSSYSSYFT